MRKLFGWVLLGFVLMAGTEGVCSYVLYRHYAHIHRAFSPSGVAVVQLAGLLLGKAEGRRADEPDLSIDHRPLFRADATLGYTLYPGTYQIVERLNGMSHRFMLNVDASGHRSTSFQHSAAARRIFIAGDSALFGWGLDDDQTTAWLLQTRFPQFDVVNLSLTSYSTIQSMLQLSNVVPAVTAEDVIVLTYHPITNTFNTAGLETIAYLKAGFEHQLGDAELAKKMTIPYAVLAADGHLTIEHLDIPCGPSQPEARPCNPPKLNSEDAGRVTELAFDAIMAAHPAHFVIAFLSGVDSDPVLAHMRSKGATIVDLRVNSGDPDANDEQQVDGHSGPFFAHWVAERLADALKRNGIGASPQEPAP